MTAAPPIVDFDQDFTLSYDENVDWTNQIGTSPVSVFARAHFMNIQAFMTMPDVVEQARRFYTLMNMYEEFYWAWADWEWIPLFDKTDQAAYTEAVARTSGTYEPEDGEAYVRAIASLNTSEVTFVPDHDDRIVRATKGEYYQVRTRPDAVTRKLTDHFHFRYSPYTLDVVMSPVVEGNQAQAAVMIAPSMGNAQAPNLNITLPMKVPWLSTKILYRTNSTNNLQFNHADNWFGMKKYIYTPQNEWSLPNGAITTTIAIRRQSLKFFFRRPDYRAWITNPAMSLMSPEESDMLALNALNATRQGRKHVHLLSDTDAVKVGDFRVRNEVDILQEEHEERAKRVRVE